MRADAGRYASPLPPIDFGGTDEQRIDAATAAIAAIADQAGLDFEVNDEGELVIWDAVYALDPTRYGTRNQ